jgi:hypothetical protein
MAALLRWYVCSEIAQLKTVLQRLTENAGRGTA